MARQLAARGSGRRRRGLAAAGRRGPRRGLRDRVRGGAEALGADRHGGRAVVVGGLHARADRDRRARLPDPRHRAVRADRSGHARAARGGPLTWRGADRDLRRPGAAGRSPDRAGAGAGVAEPARLGDRRSAARGRRRRGARPRRRSPVGPEEGHAHVMTGSSARRAVAPGQRALDQQVDAHQDQHGDQQHRRQHVDLGRDALARGAEDEQRERLRLAGVERRDHVVVEGDRRREHRRGGHAGRDQRQGDLAERHPFRRAEVHRRPPRCGGPCPPIAPSP